jgi:hypothetical protein
MTHDARRPTHEPASEPFVAAVTGLASLRELLRAVERGQLSAVDVPGAVREYLDTHGPSIRAATAAVGEELRRQILAQLYEWRASMSPSAPADRQASANERASGPNAEHELQK